jgi:hypothetical protein
MTVFSRFLSHFFQLFSRVKIEFSDIGKQNIGDKIMEKRVKSGLTPEYWTVSH